MFAYVPDPMAMPRDICMRMYLCVECMSVYPTYFELLLPPLLRVAAGFFELLQDFLMREHPDVEMLVPDMVCLASAMPRDTMAMPIPWRCLPWRCLGSHGDASGCMYV